MSLEPGYIGVTPEGEEYVIVDVTPDYYFVQYEDGRIESILRAD